jgi:ubiquinone biosynthesis protein
MVRAIHRRLRGRPIGGPQLLREAFERLSGSLIKFGQILSLQIDSLPRAYCDELLALLDRVPPFSAALVDQVFLDELHSLPRDLYREFDYSPIASASIGQVHKATLKDGSVVAVKVQRPGVRRKFERDLILLQQMIKLILFFRVRRAYFMRDPVRELATWTDDELDYRREAANCELLASNAIHTPSERVPKIYWDLITTRVFTMEFLDGPSVAHYLRMVDEKDDVRLAKLGAQGFVPSQFSENVISNFLSDSFRFGVFHADLHPANLLVLPNNVVGYVDFGIVAVLTPEARRKQIELTLAFSTGNSEAIYESFLSICMLAEGADLAGLRHRIEEMAACWYEEPAVAGRVRFRVNVTRAMMDLLSVCRDYGVLVDREMIKYIRSTILADGLVSRLAPRFDLAQALRKVVEEYLASEASRQVFSEGSALSLVTDLTLWLDSGPSALLQALNRFRRGQFRLRAEYGPSLYTKDSALRTRTLGAAAVWAFAVLLLGPGGGFPSWHSSPFFAALAGAFVSLWTLWLVSLLLRLSRK